MPEMKTLTIDSTTYEIVDADARDRIDALEQGGAGGSGLTQEEKDLILTLFSKAAYAEDDAGTAYASLQRLWSGYTVTWNGTGYTKSNSAASVRNGATFTSQVTANTGFSIQSVTATMGGETVQGIWNNGTVTIPNVTGDIVITVTTAHATVSSISAVYTQSGTVYDTDSLDSLKSDLVVTATFSDSSTGVIAAEDYTLSGTLTVGTSTITVTYMGLSDTFNVTVSQDETYSEILLATMIPGTDFTYEAGSLAAETGDVSTSDTKNVTEFISIPNGTTSFSYKFSKFDTNSVIIWYDSEQAYIGNGYGGGSYSQGGQYGDGYTDANQDIWHAVPATAKYVRIGWRPSDNNFTKLMFKHNSKLDESVTPVTGKVYYYTYTGSSTSANSDNYLPCTGMAYVQQRPIYRRGYTFYDSEKIAVSTQAVANNIGNNIAVASGASFIRLGNTTNASTSNSSVATRNGIGLIMFSDESLSAW